MSAAPERETIFALSSGAAPAAIAIIRVSGPAAGIVLRALCGSPPPPRKAVLRSLHALDGTLLDRALVLWFPGPATATGEDLAELHLHGGRAVVTATLAALAGFAECRAAIAGEFTRRAFENGRIDLLQAEGLADLLAAETEGARRRALRLAEGGLSRRIGQWRDQLLLIGARVEAILEFGGDDPDIPPDPAIRGDIAAMVADIDACLAAPPAERLRDGVRVVLAGPPNSGKSTLINALAGRKVAIATPVPGTTRDLVEAPVVIGGIAMILIDSAGLRDAEDAVEQLGIARARRAIADADLVLWLGPPEEAPEAAALVRLHAKDDLGPASPGAAYDLAVSAHSGAGIAALQHFLSARAQAMLPTAEFSLTQGQRARLALLRNALVAAIAVVDVDETLCAEHLRAGSAALEELTGRYAVEPMLDALFGRFCIGK